MAHEQVLDLSLKPREAYQACVTALQETYRWVAWTIDGESYYGINGHGRWRPNNSVFQFDITFKILKDGQITVRLATDTMFGGPIESLAQSIVAYEQNFLADYDTKTPAEQHAIDRRAFDGTVFMSYAREDFKFANKLRRDLYLNEFEVWVDQDYLHPGDQWPRKIESAIGDAHVFVLVVSDEALASPWVKREYRHATKLKKPVFPVIHADTDIPQEWGTDLGSTQHAYLTKGKYPRGLDELAGVIRAYCVETQPAN